MMIEFSGGKIIATAHEVVVRLLGEHSISLQSSSDNVTFIGRGANVMLANSGGVKWSVKLDNSEQLSELAQSLGCDIS
ncbi:DUF3389 domain-containing protein [Vibrio metschnikovii]|uniref:DUF3389 domain-containing protein n=1 Tax=Vibrio metschnikovii TaxID=28172 RepID=UPI001C30BBDB|nr:DUF3389 domain-containing protein [Vibrio metschnikovii]